MAPKLDKGVIFPSPNWFQPSGMKATCDGWLIYAGPNRSLCILVPLPADAEEDHVVGNPEEPSYHVHFEKAEQDKLVSVDVSPEWPEKRFVISGCVNGNVKLWNVLYEDAKIDVKHVLTHDVHIKDKEELVSVGFSSKQFAVTVGVCGTLVKWNISTNVTVVYRKLLTNLRPLCMACSPHLPYHVAVGTKQGLILLLNLSDHVGHCVYKVRGYNDEVVNLSWCPQYEVLVNKSIQETLSMRLKRIRNTKEIIKDTEHVKDSEVVKNTENVKDIEDVKDTENVKDTKDVKDTPCEEKSHCSENDESCPNESEIVEEEDLFDMYKDHEHEEFGHKKFVPENILVKVKEDTIKNDYLEECEKLKNAILKLKNEPEPSIEDLVEAFDKTSVQEVDCESKAKKEQIGCDERETISSENSEDIQSKIDQKSVHVQKHMLISISKNSYIQTWSKSGKQVGSCSLYPNKNKNKPKSTVYMTVYWYKPSIVLASDHKNQLILINPLDLDSKNTMQYKPVHSIHKRVPYCITSGAPRLQVEPDLEEYPIWSVSQDRSLVQYSLERNKLLLVNPTCGAYIYSAAFCPYDGNRVAVCSGDGAIRVVSETETNCYWQNLQGKVLTIAWHPTKENLIAFGTAESRIGMMKACGSSDRPAKLLRPAGGSVYGLSWTHDSTLYATNGTDLLRYCKGADPAEVVPVSVEGVSWRVADVRCGGRGVLVGGARGGVCLLSPDYPHTVLAAAFPFDKVIHCMEWHPEQVGCSDTPSAFSDTLAVSANHKDIAILKLIHDEDGKKSFASVSTLVGHRDVVFSVQWSPHEEDLLLSTSKDWTLRIWQTLKGTCSHVFSSTSTIMSACWSLSNPTAILCGGTDCLLRLLHYTNYPESLYTAIKSVKKPKKTRVVPDKEEQPPGQNGGTKPDVPEVPRAAELDRVLHSKRFLLPICQKELNTDNINACRKMFQNYLAEKAAKENEEIINIPVEIETANIELAKQEISDDVTNDEEITCNETLSRENHIDKEKENGITESNTEVNKEDYDTNFIKMFGTMNEVNELLDLEQSRHLSSQNHDAWVVLGMFRGRVGDVMQFAATRDTLTPLLVALAPAVSYKYWKEVSVLYANQLERMYASRKEVKVYDSRRYGGPIYQRACVQLAGADIQGALDTLTAAELYKEAYLLCRVRHATQLADNVLAQWRRRATVHSAHVLDIAAGDLSAAAVKLSRRKSPEHLRLAAEIATQTGQHTFANYISEQLDLIQKDNKTTQDLADLPSRVDAMLRLDDIDNKSEVNCNLKEENGVLDTEEQKSEN